LLTLDLRRSTLDLRRLTPGRVYRRGVHDGRPDRRRRVSRRGQRSPGYRVRRGTARRPLGVLERPRISPARAPACERRAKGRSRPRRAIAHRPDARDGDQGPRHARRRGQEGRDDGSFGSDEDGVARSGSGGRHRRGCELPRRRSGAAGADTRNPPVGRAAMDFRGRKITIVEVGPRDGLQNEHARVSTADKIEFVNRLSEARLPVIEVTAFVSPKWVPQMADAAEVLAGIARRADTRYTALVPNLAGLERALQAGLSEIA